jgi:hypothetical protein
MEDCFYRVHRKISHFILRKVITSSFSISALGAFLQLLEMATKNMFLQLWMRFLHWKPRGALLCRLWAQPK